MRFSYHTLLDFWISCSRSENFEMTYFGFYWSWDCEDFEEIVLLERIFFDFGRHPWLPASIVLTGLEGEMWKSTQGPESGPACWPCLEKFFSKHPCHETKMTSMRELRETRSKSLQDRAGERVSLMRLTQMVTIGVHQRVPRWVTSTGLRGKSTTVEK